MPIIIVMTEARKGIKRFKFWRNQVRKLSRKLSRGKREHAHSWLRVIKRELKEEWPKLGRMDL